MRKLMRKLFETEHLKLEDFTKEELGSYGVAWLFLISAVVYCVKYLLVPALIRNIDYDNIGIHTSLNLLLLFFYFVFERNSKDGALGRKVKFLEGELKRKGGEEDAK